MKIAVFGWYGHDNAGDERIRFCLSNFLMSLEDINTIDFFDLHQEAVKGPTPKFDSYDLVIVGGGGLILSRHNYHDFILSIKPPIVTAGISVETSLTGNPKKFVQALLEKSKYFFVRDQESAQKIDPFDMNRKVRVSGDLTFLKPYIPVKIISDTRIGINLLPRPQHLKYSSLSSHLLSFGLRQLGRLGLPNPIKFSDPKSFIIALRKSFPLLPIPLYCVPQDKNLPLHQKNDVEFLKLYFSEVSDYFSEDLMNECSLIISMRLHGAIFAVQKAIPIISLSYLPKNRNFMKEAGLEKFVLDDINFPEIMKMINLCLDNTDFLRSAMINYTQRITEITQRDLSIAVRSIM